MRPPPPPERAVVIAGLGLIVLAILALGCGSAPGRYDRSLEPPVLGLDHCAMALTEDGESIRLCASADLVCRYAVGLAKRYGRAWIIRPAKLRLAKVGDCEKQPQVRIDVQHVELHGR